MTIDEKIKSIVFDILNSNLKDIFNARYKKDTMFVGHSGGGCFHIYLEDPILNWEMDGRTHQEYWVINPIGEHDNGGDADIDFSSELNKEGYWITSIDSVDGYLDYIDSFENIVKRIEDGSLAKVIKSKALKKANELVKDVYEDELFLARLLGVLEEE